jgi:hypothetical protein
VHEILTAVIRAALADQALATGLEARIAEMQTRRDRLQERAAKRGQIAKDVMVELDLKRLTAPDFTAPSAAGLRPSWLSMKRPSQGEVRDIALTDAPTSHQP